LLELNRKEGHKYNKKIFKIKDKRTKSVLNRLLKLSADLDLVT